MYGRDETPRAALRAWTHWCDSLATVSCSEIRCASTAVAAEQQRSDVTVR
jgi:hypothetical protein